MRAAFAFLLIVSGCTRADRLGRAIDDSRFVPKSDRQIEHELGGYPSPGPSATSFAEVPDGLTFAAEVVSFQVGSPPPILEGTDADEALGPPDYRVDNAHPPRMVSLGNGGTLVLRFDGRGLGDVPGPDLFVWEVGPSVEAIEVSISDDGHHWIAVGTMPGGSSSLDIGPFVHPGDSFHFVRLHDVAFQGAESDAWPGADIDAVGVLSAEVKRVVLPSEVLFAFDRDELDPSAAPALDAVVADVLASKGARVAVEGHTDDVGADDYNQRLSERRARAVAAYLASKGIAQERIESRGYGASKPSVPNDGDEGRKKNRRVEIVVQTK